MSLHDRAPRPVRPRWPAQFDIEGVPRETDIRNRRKLELQESDPEENRLMPQNEFDINRPPRPPYKHQDYPRMLYRGAKTLVVADAAAEEEATAKGYSRTPDGKKILDARAKENKKILRAAPGLVDGDAAEANESA